MGNGGPERRAAQAHRAEQDLNWASVAPGSGLPTPRLSFTWPAALSTHPDPAAMDFYLIWAPIIHIFFF